MQNFEGLIILALSIVFSGHERNSPTGGINRGDCDYKS